MGAGGRRTFLALALAAVEPGGLLPIVGTESTYSVRPGDSLSGVGARHGVDSAVLARRNGLSPEARLRLAQTLRVDNRHVVPRVLEEGILINVPQRLLFVFEAAQLAAWYPVGLGRPDWRTPLGSFYILTKERDPTWDVPASIQREMKEKGERVRTKVAPGPENPLGRHWLGLSSSGCGIHGTNAPASVYRFGTHGCIRLHPEDVADLFARVGIGTPVEIVYEPVLLGRDDRGVVFLEVHPDVYRLRGDPSAAAADLARAAGVEGISVPAWEAAIQNAEGLAVPVSPGARE